MVVGNDGTAFSFTAKVHLNGTFESGSRDGDWYQTGNNVEIANHWRDLTTAWHYRWQAYVNWDWGIIVKPIEDALKAAGTVVQLVIPIVTAL